MDQNAKGLLALTGAFLVAALSGSASYIYGTSDTVRITVKDKGHIVEKSYLDNQFKSKAAIITDGETFENTDSWIRLKFNAKEIQNKLQIGKSYDCTVYGLQAQWRMPFHGKHRNIVSCEEVKAPKP